MADSTTVPQVSPEPEDLKKAKARITRRSASPVQSGPAHAGEWMLEFEPEEKPEVEPLMGWISSGDANQQLRLTFPSLDRALAYCRREGIAYDVLLPRPRRRRPKSYADNFLAP